MLNSIVLIQPYLAGLMCHNPNPLEWALIIALVGGCAVFSGAGVVATVSIATTIVTLIIAGEPIAAIAAAITSNIAVALASIEGVAQVVYAIKEVLGC